LKIDVFFFFGFTLQFAWLVLYAATASISTPLLVHLFVSIPGTVVILALAYYAVILD
jgi:hypothetical protein